MKKGAKMKSSTISQVKKRDGSIALFNPQKTTKEPKN